MWVTFSISSAQADYIRLSEITGTSLHAVSKTRQTYFWLYRGRWLSASRSLPNRRWRHSNGTLSSSVRQRHTIMNTSTTRILGEEMGQLKTLAEEGLHMQILDHEKYKSMIQQIFQRVKEATTLFQVRTIIFIYGYVCEHWSFSDRNDVQYPEHRKSDTRRHQS